MDETVLKFEIAFACIFAIAYVVTLIVFAVRGIKRIVETCQCRRQFGCPVRDCLDPGRCFKKRIMSKQLRETIIRKIADLDSP